MRRAIKICSALFVSTLPFAASAHEVYVLSPAQITYALGIPPFDMWAVIVQDLGQFTFWGFITALVIFVVFFISLIRPLERKLAPVFKRMRPWAPAIARITVGLAFLAGAYYQATYGPELPIAATYGAFAPYLTALLIVMGTLIILGIWVRAAALCALALYTVSVYFHGIYMLTYINYLGEVLVLLILGTHTTRLPAGRQGWLQKTFAPYAWALLRVCFGVSLLYASLYAKILHNNLALMVASLPLGHTHPVAYYFHLEPHFLVLGAAIIEIVIAVFFILGIEIRFTSLFLEFWLSLSLIYFGEVVWPHLILIGIPIAFICYGYDKYSVEGYFFKKRRLEPVL